MTARLAVGYVHCACVATGGVVLALFLLVENCQAMPVKDCQSAAAIEGTISNLLNRSGSTTFTVQDNLDAFLRTMNTDPFGTTNLDRFAALADMVGYPLIGLTGRAADYDTVYNATLQDCRQYGIDHFLEDSNPREFK